MNNAFDRPPAGRASSGTDRLIGLDVTRAIALIGVVMMNYHGIMNYPQEPYMSESLVERIFDVRTGALSTRFAATFVVVAGAGISLMTRSVSRDPSPAGIRDMQLRLARRGTVLLIGGFFLDWAWPGTILFYYGAYFILAAILFRLSTRALALVAGSVSAVAVGIAIWRRSRLLVGDSTRWVNPSDIESVQDFFVRIFIGYTHPVFPWLAFLIAGMILGRNLNALGKRGIRLAGVFVYVVALTYALASAIRTWNVEDHAVLYIVSAMQSGENGLAYIVSTAAIALAAFVVISRAAEAGRSLWIVAALRRAGQLSLTLYLGHVLFYYAVVEWLGWGFGTGLGSAIALSLAYWIIAITAGSWWHHRVGSGPAERLYRWLGS